MLSLTGIRACHRLTGPHSLHLARSFSALRPSLVARNETKATPAADAEYHGPLRNTFRRLKLFSLTSFGLSATLAPFMFIVEANLPLSARVALAGTALATSGASTALVAWCGKPYVNTLRRLGKNKEDGVEMVTTNLFLQPRITRVYDQSFLVKTDRYFAEWELAPSLILRSKPEEVELEAHPAGEETVAETFDKQGNVVGRWIVSWGGPGNKEGTCREVGKIVRHFNVHEELLQ